MPFDGCISYEFFQGCNVNEISMDLILWDSLENAEIAALKVKEIQKESDFKEYINSFEKWKYSIILNQSTCGLI
jgi:hypothetical protein